jgi:hypothetical protein
MNLIIPPPYRLSWASNKINGLNRIFLKQQVSLAKVQLSNLLFNGECDINIHQNTAYNAGNLRAMLARTIVVRQQRGR